MRLATDKGYEFRLTHNGELTEHSFTLPSVTTIIKTVLGGSFGPASWWGYKLGVHSQWLGATEAELEKKLEAAKKTHITPNKVRDSAGDRGNNAHAMLEWLADGHSPSDFQGNVDGYCEGVIAWWEAQKNWEPLASEQPVWSLKHGFAGTMDLVRHHMDDEYEIVDLKTHKPNTKVAPAYVEDLLQLRAYAMCWREDPLIQWPRTRVLVACADGTYLEDVRTVSEQAFLNVLELYRTMKEVA